MNHKLKTSFIIAFSVFCFFSIITYGLILYALLVSYNVAPGQNVILSEIETTPLVSYAGIAVVIFLLTFLMQSLPQKNILRAPFTNDYRKYTFIAFILSGFWFIIAIPFMGFIAFIAPAFALFVPIFVYFAIIIGAAWNIIRTHSYLEKKYVFASLLLPALIVTLILGAVQFYKVTITNPKKHKEYQEQIQKLDTSVATINSSTTFSHPQFSLLEQPDGSILLNLNLIMHTVDTITFDSLQHSIIPDIDISSRNANGIGSCKIDNVFIKSLNSASEEDYTKLQPQGDYPIKIEWIFSPLNCTASSLAKTFEIVPASVILKTKKDKILGSFSVENVELK